MTAIEKQLDGYVFIYHVILLPSYESSNLVKKEKSRIGKKTTRSIYNWDHNRFKINLLNKAKQFRYCMVSVINESYTSVTWPSGKCVVIKTNGFTDKNFHCDHCQFLVDRDENGCSRNILIKHLSNVL
jgi:putative transposase